MSLRMTTVLLLCLALLGARATGLHFHVSHGADADHEHAGLLTQRLAVDHHEHEHEHEHEHDHGADLRHPVETGHVAAHLTSDLDAGHLDDHAAKHQIDVDADTGPPAKVPAIATPMLFLVFCGAFALAAQLSSGFRVPFQWLRPPPVRGWPSLLLPPSQGPPRAR